MRSKILQKLIDQTPVEINNFVDEEAEKMMNRDIVLPDDDNIDPNFECFNEESGQKKCEKQCDFCK